MSGFKGLRRTNKDYPMSMYRQVSEVESKTGSLLCRNALWEFFRGKIIMGQLHDDVIFLQLPESFRLLISSAN